LKWVVRRPGVFLGYFCARHEATLDNRAGEARLSLTEQQRPHARIQPIRTNQEIAADHLAAFELDGHMVIRLLEGDHAAPGAD
jgi:hypothetical protein